MNQIPYDGFCFVTPTQGIAADTYFSITCREWKDLNGAIQKYEYFSKLEFKNRNLKFSLKYSV